MNLHPVDCFRNGFSVYSRCSVVLPYSLHRCLHILYGNHFVYEILGLLSALLFDVFRQEDARHFRILFVFRTIPLRTVLFLEIFCFHRILLSSNHLLGIHLGFALRSISITETSSLLWLRLTSAGSTLPSMYSGAYRFRLFLQTSPGKA